MLAQEVVMQLLGVLPTALHPIGDGALIQPKSRHNGLGWAAVAEQAQHQRHHIHRLFEAIQGRCGRVRKGLAAAATAIAPFLATMDRDRALAHLASCRAVHSVAELCLRVHAVSFAARGESLALRMPYEPGLFNTISITV